MAVIDVQQIGKRYHQPGRGVALVLRDVDLTVQAGAVCGLLGPNGAGRQR